MASEQRYQEQLQKSREEERLKEEAYQNAQNHNALQFLDKVSASLTKSVSSIPQDQDFRGTILCKGEEPGLHTCYVIVCGGAYGGDPICCPEGFPKLNECDCHCHRANADFECKRYTGCQHSYKQANMTGGAQ